MVNMDVLKKAVKYVLWSAYIEGERPISLLIIAKPESGKTIGIEPFSNNKGIVYVNDTTPWGAIEEIYKMHGKGETIRHLVMPDFLNILAKNEAASKAMIQFLNSALDEGITRIKTFGIDYNIPPIKFGLITAITKDAFSRREAGWIENGFLSRLIPFSYQYTMGAAQQILEEIYDQKYMKSEEYKLEFPEEKIKVELTKDMARKVEMYRSSLAMAEKTYGFRVQKEFQCLLKAIALSKGKLIVDEEDLKDFEEMANYFNMEFNYIDSNGKFNKNPHGQVRIIKRKTGKK